MRPALELIGITKDYGRVRAVDNLSLSVPEGSLFGLIGPNGAGKTTTFALLSGFLRPTEGTIKVRGRALTPGRPPVGSILALPQDASLPPNKRVHGALVFLARLGGIGSDEASSLATRALERVGLADLAGRKVSQLSHGQRRRVGIAQTLIGRDEVIILDEPTAGLDPRTAEELGRLIKSLHQDRTIILSSHNLREMQDLCTHAAILNKGKLELNGTMDEIRGTGGLFTVLLTKPLEQPEAAVAALRALDGVEGVELADGRDSLRVRSSSTDGLDDLTNGVLKALMDHGASVKSVERGQSLTERFMEATGQQ